MRDIKFRYFDKRENTYADNMVNGQAFAFSNDGVVRLDTIDGLWRDTSLIAEQFTGLKDKNGVGIYEGDIIRWLNLNGPLEIKYSDLHACFVSKNHRGEDMLTKGTAMESEVIGNIHKHTDINRELDLR